MVRNTGDRPTRGLHNVSMAMLQTTRTLPLQFMSLIRARFYEEHRDQAEYDKEFSEKYDVDPNTTLISS